jgi:hypothetical protein
MKTGYRLVLGAGLVVTFLVAPPAMAAENDEAKNALRGAWEGFYSLYVECMDDSKRSPTAPRGELFIEIMGSGLKDKFDSLKAAVDKAAAAGVPEDFELKSDRLAIKDLAMTFGQVKKKMDEWKEAAYDNKKFVEKKKEQVGAQDQEDFGPFYKVLKGDKLQWFKENCRARDLGGKRVEGACQCRGRRGKCLETPEDFQQAKVIYYFSSNDNWPYGWRLTGAVFKGNKRARIRTDEGTGSKTPPKRAYK